MNDPAICAAFEADLSALVDGDLEPARESEVRAHAAGCARCAERLARLARADVALRSLPAAETAGDLAERLRVRLDEERRRAASAGDRARSQDREPSLDAARGGSGGRDRRTEGDDASQRSPDRMGQARTTRPASSGPKPPHRLRWIPLTVTAAAAAIALYLVVATPRPAHEPTLADRERAAPEPEVAVREVPTPLPDELVAGPELEVIEEASDDELAVALDLDTLADFDVIERLHVLEQLAALDGSR